ncbi:MAG: extracellular solute-binding protein [Halanaerobiaceae bacterium]|nr:extracellular solute-binding protein [Halanaerobiaceae bacterium]
MKKILFVVTLMLTLVAGTLAHATEITFWAMNNAPSDVHIAWMNQKAAEFEAKTGIKVVFEEIGWGDGPRIMNAIITGEGAHVFQLGTTWNPEYAATGGLVEIDINEFGGADKFFAANLESTILDGKYYGVPWFAETRVLFYNTEMFEQAGVRPPQTYEQLIKVGKELIKVHGEGKAIATAGTNAWDLIHNWAIILWAHGGDMLNEDNTAAVFNSPAGVAAMDYWVSLVQLGLADKACAEYNQPQADAAFINGDAAMAFMGPWNIADIEHDNPGLKYSIVEPPAGPYGRASFSGGSNLAIRNNASKEEIRAAIEWVKFLVSDDVLADYTKNLTKMIPANKAALEDPYYDNELWQTFITTLSYATAYPAIPEWGPIEGVIQTNFGNVLSDFVNGTFDDKTSKGYLDAAVAEVNAILSK